MLPMDNHGICREWIHQEYKLPKKMRRVIMFVRSEFVGKGETSYSQTDMLHCFNAVSTCKYHCIF